MPAISNSCLKWAFLLFILINLRIASSASRLMDLAWRELTASECLGVHKDYAFIDPDYCEPACPDAPLSLFCSITFGAQTPDCYRALPNACSAVVDRVLIIIESEVIIPTPLPILVETRPTLIPLLSTSTSNVSVVDRSLTRPIRIPQETSTSKPTISPWLQHLLTTTEKPVDLLIPICADFFYKCCYWVSLDRCEHTDYPWIATMCPQACGLCGGYQKGSSCKTPERSLSSLLHIKP